VSRRIVGDTLLTIGEREGAVEDSVFSRSHLA